MTKKIFIKTLNKIDKMDKTDLSKFVQKLFLVKQDIQKETFEALSISCDLRNAYLMDRLTENAYIEMSELRAGKL